MKGEEKNGQAQYSFQHRQMSSEMSRSKYHLRQPPHCPIQRYTLEPHFGRRVAIPQPIYSISCARYDQSRPSKAPSICIYVFQHIPHSFRISGLIDAYWTQEKAVRELPPWFNLPRMHSRARLCRVVSDRQPAPTARVVSQEGEFQGSGGESTLRGCWFVRFFLLLSAPPTVKNRECAA